MSRLKKHHFFKSTVVSPITAAAFLFVCLHGSICGINASSLSGLNAPEGLHTNATCRCECHKAIHCGLISYTTVSVTGKTPFSELAPVSHTGVTMISLEHRYFRPIHFERSITPPFFNLRI
jgi:hypothetical protein